VWNETRSGADPGFGCACQGGFSEAFFFALTSALRRSRRNPTAPASEATHFDFCQHCRFGSALDDPTGGAGGRAAAPKAEAYRAFIGANVRGRASRARDLTRSRKIPRQPRRATRLMCRTDNNQTGHRNSSGSLLFSSSRGSETETEVPVEPEHSGGVVIRPVRRSV